MSASTRNKHSTSSDFNKTRPEPSDLDITKDEFDRISDAMKNAEFRKLFVEYCEEILDPENRKRYEEEIIQLEAERGVEVRFINPEPGFVVKTSVDGAQKCFVNISQSAEVAKLTSEACLDPKTGKHGLSWSIPLAQSNPRDDVDTQGKRCRVYDVIFHPDALYLAQRNQTFHKCLIETALDAVEREFKVTLDRTNLKYPKLKFKGVARAIITRKLAEGAATLEPHPLDNIYPAMPSAEPAQPKVVTHQPNVEPLPEFTTPKYVIKHQRDVDLAEYTDEWDAKFNLTVPAKLIVEIALPLLSTTAECRLDVTERELFLLSERPTAKYRLKLPLPFAVDDKSGNARFDTDTRRLTISLPVLQQRLTEQRTMQDAHLHYNREDSGVESDIRDNVNSDGGSESPIKELLTEVDQGDESVVVPTTSIFLKDSIQYHFPSKFDINVLGDGMSAVVHIANVQPDSIEILQLPRGVHLQFSNISGGFYPVHYAFYLQLLPDISADICSAEAEAWENNVVLSLTLTDSAENIASYMAGLDGNDLREYNIQEHFQLKQRSLITPACPVDISVNRCENESAIEIAVGARLPAETADGESGAAQDDADKKAPSNKKQKRRNKKRRSLSESACDDIKSYEQQQQLEKSMVKRESYDYHDNDDESSPVRPDGSTEEMLKGQQQQQQQMQRFKIKQRSYSESRGESSLGSSGLSFKGILKHGSRYGVPRRSISDSCSSIDDYSSSYSNSADDAGVGSLMRFSKSFSDIPEENVDGLSESCKKTVRFNEVIEKQIFRLDSSILGQKKKNQKRRDRKQRALQRRLSEGDSADYEETDKPVAIPARKPNPGKNAKLVQQHGNIDLTAGRHNKAHHKNNRKSNKEQSRLESESYSDPESNKNLMMFEMDM